jgi:alpha-N-arabinofuranosidase
MARKSRRTFLKQAGTAGAALAASRFLAPAVFAQLGPARIYIDPAQKIAPLDRRVLGSFLEHLGRAIYEGIYDPGSKHADANGFRKDVAEEIKMMGVPMVRYPGGNFVSGYNWLDGVGPRDKRPTVLDKAWNTLESNQFGTNEFMAWCKLVGTEPLMGMNLGTGSPEMCAALVEYCNQAKGTKWSDLRRSHGIEQPYKVKSWCIGNEMDGPWQIGHMTAREYGRKARDAANQMRMVDESLELIACGSSGILMPTYLEWDREVLEECYDLVDAISLHAYYRNDEAEFGAAGDTSKYLAFNLLMDRQIEEIIGVCDYVRGRMRSPKSLWLSFDEWNVWYRARNGDGQRQFAPHLLEEVYDLQDGLLVGGLINSLLRHADRVKVACLAQLVNVIAPITTNKDGFFRHTIYYPYLWALQAARGDVLDIATEAPTYEVRGLGQPSRGGRFGRPAATQVPFLDAVATLDEAGKKLSLFVLNRDIAKPREVELVFRETPPGKVQMSQVLTGPDLKAFNSFEKPNNVTGQAFEVPKSGARVTVQLPARSYTVIQWGA